MSVISQTRRHVADLGYALHGIHGRNATGGPTTIARRLRPEDGRDQGHGHEREAIGDGEHAEEELVRQDLLEDLVELGLGLAVLHEALHDADAEDEAEDDLANHRRGYDREVHEALQALLQEG